VNFRWVLLCAVVLAAAATCTAQARDFEMGGDNVYNIMAPEPGTVSHHTARNKRGRTLPSHTQSQTATRGVKDQAAKDQAAKDQDASPLTDTPEQIETYKRNRRAFAWRGSSGIVLPTPLPGPTHYAPIGSPAVVRALPQDQPPTILPGSGRAIPNLPHGPETFQDRASRCAFQSSINSVPGGQMSSYMHNCAM
jgi:hypothetical protein